MKKRLLSLKEETKYDFFSFTIYQFKERLFYYLNGYYKSYPPFIILSHVIGSDSPSSEYTLHFRFKDNLLKRYYQQFEILKSSTPNIAIEWLKYTYQFIKEKHKYLRYFEDDIPYFIALNKLNDKELESLNACLFWVSEEFNKLKIIGLKEDHILEYDFWYKRLTDEPKQSIFFHKVVNHKYNFKTVYF